ncbi:MAG: hypothetical protein FGF51_04600 [Candidatus Brockarchaeota archaeon]|nr:hypothetical protein [Candidatus Brockarchaeota archaeon]
MRDLLLYHISKGLSKTVIKKSGGCYYGLGRITRWEIEEKIEKTKRF